MRSRRTLGLLSVIAVGVAASLPTGTASASATVRAPIPHPDHVVVLIMENHAYGEIVGDSSAPYLNSLAAGGANFTQSFAVTHPSEPNYLALFSGSAQGVTDDSCPHRFTTPNLGRSLANAGKTFAGYSEDLPATGSTVCTSGAYARKHNPWSFFANVPPNENKPLTGFPTDFTRLPNVSFVVPNLNDDMHDGSVAQGDAWTRAHLGAYASWAAAHNSILMVTFDEDDATPVNQIPTIFYGAHVKTGNYATPINHYNVLRTLTQMFGTGHPGASASATAITGCWT